jgi:hypothetical protein
MIRKLTLATILLCACTEKNPAMRNPPNSGNIVEANGAEEREPRTVDESNGSAANERRTFSLGWRSIDQINQTFAALTGVPVNSLRAAFVELRTQLSTTTVLEEVTPAKVGAMSKLAANYCDTAMRNDALRANILGPGAPSGHVAEPDALAEKLTNAFWGVEVQDEGFVANGRAVIVELTTELAKGKADAAAVNVLVGVCAAVLASSPVAIF